MIKLTVFITTYNRYELFMKTLESVINQSYFHYQIIILDNNSTDLRYRSLVNLNSKKIQYIKHDKNIGSGGNLNFAIKNAQTEFFMIFHDDDIMHKQMLKRQIELLEGYPEVSAVSCQAYIINYDGKVISESQINSSKAKLKIYKGDEYIKAYFKNKHDILCPSVIFRTKFIQNNKLQFLVDAGPAADQVLWFDILKVNGKILVSNDKLFYYRVHQNQDSGINSLTMHLDLLIYLSKSDYYKNHIKNFPFSYKLRTLLKLIKLNVLVPEAKSYYYKKEVNKIIRFYLLNIYSFILFLPVKLFILIKNYFSKI